VPGYDQGARGRGWPPDDAASLADRPCFTYAPLRKVLNPLSPVEAMELMLERQSKTKANREFDVLRLGAG
jgi:hypothetical protein